MMVRPMMARPHVQSEPSPSDASQSLMVTRTQCSSRMSWLRIGHVIHAALTFVVGMVVLAAAVTRRHGVVAAVAERVAAQQAPGRQPGAADGAVLTQRPDGVVGARRVVLAARAEQRREGVLVHPDERDEDRAGHGLHACGRLPQHAGARQELSQGLADQPLFTGVLTRDEVEQLRSCDHDEIVLLSQTPRAGLYGLAEQTLDTVADDGAAQLLRDRQPQPRPLGARLRRALERVEHEEAGGRRRPLPVDALEVRRPRETGTFAGHGPAVRRKGACAPSAAAS